MDRATTPSQPATTPQPRARLSRLVWGRPAASPSHAWRYLAISQVVVACFLYFAFLADEPPLPQAVYLVVAGLVEVHAVGRVVIAERRR